MAAVAGPARHGWGVDGGPEASQQSDCDEEATHGDFLRDRTAGTLRCGTIAGTLWRAEGDFWGGLAGCGSAREAPRNELWVFISTACCLGFAE